MTQEKTPAATEVTTSALDSAILAERHDIDKLELVISRDEARIDSRVLARHFGKDHHDVFELVKQYRTDFEQMGIVRFQTEKITPGRGRPVRFALLTEDQAYLLLTYTRNTVQTRALKIKLVKAFSEARRAASLHGSEYLPTYHELHDRIHALAAGSPNEKFVHMNVNKLVNRAAGIESGRRSNATMPQQSILIVAQAVAAQTLRHATDYHTGFQQAKAALLALSRVALIEGSVA